jgi:hypothetical protein
LSHENNWLTNGLKGKRYGRHDFRRFPVIGGALSSHKIQIRGFSKCSASQILGPYRVSSSRRSSHIFLLLRLGNLYRQLASLIWVLQQICCWRIHDERSGNFYSLGPNPNRGKGAELPFTRRVGRFDSCCSREESRSWCWRVGMLAFTAALRW